MTTGYRERLSAPWWAWLVVGGLALSVGWVLLVALPPPAVLAVTVAVAAAGGWALRSWAAPVEVCDGHLRAGRARIPVACTGPAVPLDAATAAHVRGPGIDPRAFHLIRGWVPTAVLVDVEDPQDPTPYWYVSTRRPADLVRALEEARRAG